MKKYLIAATIISLWAAIPASAAEMATCDDATLMKVDEAMKADTKPEMKEAVEMAMKEMDMAKMAMKDSKMEECSMHIAKAMEQMMMKP